MIKGCIVYQNSPLVSTQDVELHRDLCEHAGHPYQVMLTKHTGQAIHEVALCKTKQAGGQLG